MNNINEYYINLANQTAAWLKNYAENCGRKAFVVGVSGGVDSALVSTLCGMAGLPTHCVILPCQSKDTETLRGSLHINWLQTWFGCWGNGIHSHIIDLTKTFETFSSEVEPYYGYDGLAYANAKSRLRMVALYHLATIHGGLVVGTGNKVEDGGVKFFTKYGDGGVDISPIADYTKTEVRATCRALGVLSELSEAVPTDGLWEDARTDEGQLGATYEELEWAMEWRETTVSESSSLLTDRQKEVLAIYDKWHNAGAHKMEPIPTFKR